MPWTSLKQKEALQPCRDPSAKHNVGDHARRRTKTCNLATRRQCFITSTLSNYLVEKMADAARSLHCSATQYPESGHLICESTTHGKGRWHVEKTDQSREADPFFVAWCQGKVSPGSATLPGTSWYHSFQTICFSEVDSAWEPPPFVQSSNLTQCSMVDMILQRLGWTWRRGLTFNESGMLMSYCLTVKLHASKRKMLTTQAHKKHGRRLKDPRWFGTGSLGPIRVTQRLHLWMRTKKKLQTSQTGPTLSTNVKAKLWPTMSHPCHRFDTLIYLCVNLIEGGVGIPNPCCERIPAMLLMRFVWSCIR